MLVTLVGFFYQALIPLLITVPFIYPRLIGIQGSLAIFLYNNQGKLFLGRNALQQSKTMLKQCLRPFGILFATLFVLEKAMDPLKQVCLAALPQRFFTQVPEIPFAIMVFASLIQFICERLVFLAPLVILTQKQMYPELYENQQDTK
eukprot:TRINITY_DN16181_c1_g1_i2.p4 TRINITY_DN16181_c1_g1~~TRINITY_DN16181_c1_g1_i2.p4  ORF type:complete len:147 (-),score=13.74 TRINITY_DN16181_c1_g1_i2:1257-1697(-)